MFRRKSSSSAGESVEVEGGLPGEATDPDQSAEDGPWDSADIPDDGIERIDLGSLLVPAMDGAEVRLQVDEASGQVQSVMLAGEEGALELRAFAAPRNGDLWSEVRPQIAADISQHGGTATPREGRWGTELVCQMQVVMPDGSNAVQPSRIIGVNGDRWLLRGTFLGRPAVEVDAADDWEDALSRVAVHRGTQAMPVGDSLPVALPTDAQRLPEA